MELVFSSHVSSSSTAIDSRDRGFQTSTSIRHSSTRAAGGSPISGDG